MSEMMVMKPLLAVVGMIIVLAGYGLMTSGINDWTLLTYDTGSVNGARVERVAAPISGTTLGDSSADDVWYHDSLTQMGAAATELSAGEYATLANDGSGGCVLNTTGTLASGTITEVYSQGGTKLAINATGVIGNCVWKEASGIWDTFGFQQLIRLTFQAAALALPIAVLYMVYQFGKNFITGYGIHPLLGVVALIVVFLLATRLLDTVTPFVESASDAVGAVRFLVYTSGLGTLAQIVGNFYGVVLAGGLLPLGWEVFRLFKGASMGAGFSGMGNRGM